MSDTRLQHWVLGLLGVLLLASYGPLVQAGYVWDDIPLIVQNTLTGDWGNILAFFQVDLWESAGGAASQSGYYRPAVLVSFAVDRSLFGDWAGGAHLHSLAWHVLGVGLLFALLRQLFGRWPALVGAGLFALHPLQSEAIAWVAARNDLMVSALSLGSLLLLLPREASWQRILGGSVLALAALLSKESAVLLPVLLVALDWVRFRSWPGWPRLAGLLLAVGLWFGLRTLAGIQAAAVPDADQARLLLSSFPAVLGHYGLRLFTPWPLSIGATLEYLPPWRALGLVALLGTGGVLVWKGRWMSAFGLLFAVLSFLPALVAVGVRGQLGERYLYLPMAGLAWALAAALPKDRRSLWGLVVLLLAHLLVVPKRVSEWSSERSLWESAVEVDPNGFALASLGHVYNRDGEHEAAAALFRQALEDEPAYIDACPHAVRIGLRVQRIDLALQGAEVVGRRCPATPELLGLVALARLQGGDLEGARRALARWDGSPDSRLPLVAAALAHLDGDSVSYQLQRAQVPDPLAFDAQVQALLAASELE